MTDRRCAWCNGPIAIAARRDSITCSKRCRQARHRFITAVGVAPRALDGQPRRLAYADPPYPGLSARYYADHPDYAGEVDHEQLIARLSAEYDAWALSTSAYALQNVLSMCPRGVRVAAWHRGERPNQGALAPQNGWEPVILGGDLTRRTSTSSEPSRGSARRVVEDLHDASPGDDQGAIATRRVPEYSHDGSVSVCGRPTRLLIPSQPDPRRVATDGGHDGSPPGRHDASRTPGADASSRAGTPRRVDSLVYFARPRLTDPARVIGAKPATFCRWLFELLGATAEDTFVDLFPGSGGVRRAWETYVSSGTVVEGDAS